jgi:transposase-like protein
MRSRHSAEEKFEIVMELLTESVSQAEICREVWDIPNTQLAKWKEQFIESGKKGLSDGRHPQSRDEEIDDLKRMIGEQTLVINAFKKRLQGGSR